MALVARGLYENQDATQAEMNLRGRFVTLDDGSFSFTSVKPAGYPVPIDGPNGALLRAQKRHNFRPAHLHFLIYKPGYKTIASQVYDPADPHLETDSQFGVTEALIGKYEREGDAYRLRFTFVIEPARRADRSRPSRKKSPPSAAHRPRDAGLDARSCRGVGPVHPSRRGAPGRRVLPARPCSAEAGGARHRS